MKIRSAVLGAVMLVILLTAGAAQSLSGSNTVNSDDIVDGTIRGADIHDKTIPGTKLASNAVTGAKVANGTIGSADLAADSVAGSKVANGGLTGDDIADQSIPAEKLGFHACSVSVPANGSQLTYRCTGAPIYSFFIFGVTHPAAGVYCLTSNIADYTIAGGAVTIDAAASNFPAAYMSLGASYGCPAGTKVTVTTYLLTVGTAPGNVGGTLTDKEWHGFFF